MSKRKCDKQIVIMEIYYRNNKDKILILKNYKRFPCAVLNFTICIVIVIKM